MQQNTVWARLRAGVEPRDWLIVLGVASLLAAGAIVLLPFATPMPQYWQDAQQYLRTGHITDTTYPLEFAWLTGLSLRLLGHYGPEALQAIFYVSSVLGIWGLARLSGARPGAAVVAALVAAVYPQLPASVVKIWDLESSVWLMVLLMLATVGLARYGLRPWLVAGAGLVFGLSLAQRPNMMLLLPLLLYVCLATSASWKRKAAAVAGAAALTLVTFAGVNVAAHGSFFLPQNGPYNFVQGHNEYAIPVMLNDLTCEPTVAMFMKADGFPPGPIDESDPALQRYFKQRALAYIRAHPLREIELTAVKLWTVFRPNTRIHHGLSPMTFLIVLMSLIFPVWLVLLIRRKMQSELDRLDWIYVSAVVLYVLPFVITACDPRYQVPLEICLLAHIGRLAGPSPRTNDFEASGRSLPSQP